jgi:hypothetical protein
MRAQKSFAEVQVQEQDSELLCCSTPRSTSTVDIATGQMESNLMMAESQVSKIVVDRQDPGVVGLQSSPTTPGGSVKQHVVHPRLKLRMPPRPVTEEALVESSVDLVSDQHPSFKRVRKPTEKRKAAAIQAEPRGKKTKKCRR